MILLYRFEKFNTIFKTFSFSRISICNINPNLIEKIKYFLNEYNIYRDISIMFILNENKMYIDFIKS